MPPKKPPTASRSGGKKTDYKEKAREFMVDMIVDGRTASRRQEGSMGVPIGTEIKPHKFDDYKGVYKVPFEKQISHMYRAVRPNVSGGKLYPIQTGFGFYQSHAGSRGKGKLNSAFGDDTVWMAKTLRGATNFIYEHATHVPKGQRDKWEIYKIYLTQNNKIINPQKVDDRALASFLDNRSKKVFDANAKWVRAYKKHVVPMNEEMLVKGPISPDRIEKVKDVVVTRDFIEKIRKTPKYKDVQDRMEKFRDAKGGVSKAWKESQADSEKEASEKAAKKPTEADFMRARQEFMREQAEKAKRGLSKK